MNNLTELERKILNKIISEIKIWNEEFNIFNIADFYVHNIEKINDNRVVLKCKVNIERFLINGEFAEVTKDLQRCYFIKPNGFELWKSEKFETYEGRLSDDFLRKNTDTNKEVKYANEDAIKGMNIPKVSWTKKNNWWFIPAICGLVIGMIILLLSMYAHTKGKL